MSAITVNKRVMKDIVDGRTALKEEFAILIEPEENNMYNIHFVLQGPEDTPFEGGLYHGMIRLSPNHPINAPNIHMITPSGRFITESWPISNGSRGICTTATSFHPESWTPITSITTVLKGFISLMCDPNDVGVGGIKSTNEQKKKFTSESINCLKNDPIIKKLFPDLHASLINQTYKPLKIGDLSKRTTTNITNQKELSSDSETISVSSSEKTDSYDENDIICVSDSDDDIKIKKRVTKKKPIKKKSVKKIAKKKPVKIQSEFDSGSSGDSDSESPESAKSKKKPNKKPIISDSDSGENVQPRKVTKRISSKKQSKKIASESEEEYIKPRKTSKKKPNKKDVDSGSSEEYINPKKAVNKQIKNNKKQNK